MVGFLMRVRIRQGRVRVSVCLVRAQRDRRAAQTCSLWAVRLVTDPRVSQLFALGCNAGQPESCGEAVQEGSGSGNPYR